MNNGVIGYTDEQLHMRHVCLNLANFVIEKNMRYGNSALSPLRIFCKGEKPISDSILERMDDKLSRIKNSDKLRKNDVVDLMGYLVLLCVKNGWTDFTDLVD